MILIPTYSSNRRGWLSTRRGICIFRMRGCRGMPISCTFLTSLRQIVIMRRIVRIISLALLASGGASTGYGQSVPVIQRMFLVGDAGELRDGHHPVCDWLKQHVDWNDSSNVLVYLGDNIYPHGMPADGA